ncbi:transglycosylase SLT domain-containing protein [Ferrimonas balearica]|nr:transglycosylase SLT domain-containing protein [Ferrimonas balearica]MBY5991087.1 transglycosylase SLT domain-containing protein [Ferrimonas balearica]
MRRTLCLLALMLLVGCEKAPPESEPAPPRQPSEAERLQEEAQSTHHLAKIWPILAEPWGGDLDEMLRRGEIRILTSVTPGWYYIDKGQPKGATVETLALLQHYLRRQLGAEARYLRLTPIPVRRDQLIPYLEAGYGDLIIANLTITELRQQSIAFSRPWRLNVRELVVSGPHWPSLTELPQLSERALMVRQESSYFASIEAANERLSLQSLPPIQLLTADPRLEDEDLLQMVAEGHLEATVVDEHKLAPWLTRYPQLKPHPDLPLREGGRIAMGLRKESVQLKAMVDGFVAAHPIGTKAANLVIQNYLASERWMSAMESDGPFAPLPELVALFRRYGEQYNIDWVLLAAFAYQESRFDPGARSHVGAVGVMQVMPATARDKRIAIDNIQQTEPNVHAGTKYLALLRDSYFAEPELTEFNRMIFTMAAYNAGPNRINRLRKAAAERGLDPNEWFNNVEDLVAAEIGSETVRFVSNIYRYYIAYRRVLDEEAARAQVREALERTGVNPAP